MILKESNVWTLIWYPHILAMDTKPSTIQKEERRKCSRKSNQDWLSDTCLLLKVIAAFRRRINCAIILQPIYRGKIMILHKCRNKKIAQLRNLTATIRILQFSVLLYKLVLMELTNLNNKTKTKWILVVVVKCCHRENGGLLTRKECCFIVQNKTILF